MCQAATFSAKKIEATIFYEIDKGEIELTANDSEFNGEL